MKTYIESVFENHINGCLCILYDRHYWDFDSKNTIVECFTDLFKGGAGINLALEPQMSSPKASFAEGGIVIPQNKRVPIII